jgi:hypothetical protein
LLDYSLLHTSSLLLVCFLIEFATHSKCFIPNLNENRSLGIHVLLSYTLNDYFTINEN